MASRRQKTVMDVAGGATCKLGVSTFVGDFGLRRGLRRVVALGLLHRMGVDAAKQ